jgi:hypothetical protein
MRIAALVAGLVAFVIYMANGREIASYDSQPAKYLAIEIAQHHSLSLGHTVGRTPALAERPAFARDRHGNYRSAYPLPSPVIAAGFAWTLSRLRIVDLDAPLAPALIAKITASAMTALAVAFALATALRRVSGAQASLIALAFGAGTNLWASVSQTLWQQETSSCALMAAVMLLAEPDARPVRAAGAGALLGVAGWARPQLAPIVLVLAVSMIARWGRRGVIGLVPIAAAMLLAIGINVAWFGTALGGMASLETLHPLVHAASGSVSTTPWTSAAGLLVSPSRGLLVFSPIVAFAALGIPVALGEGWGSDLPWCLAAAAAEFVPYSFYQVWWGGHTYGPRYMIDVLPLLVPVAAAAFQALARRRAVAALAVASLVWSVGVAALGAFVYPADQWNTDPASVDQHHARLWDWRDSQIVRAARAGWNPNNFALFSRAAFRRDAEIP